MKTTTKSFLLVAIVIGVAAIMIAPTALAYFSATSTVENNLFTAGTISLSTTGDEIPLEASLTDLKPCMKGEGTITVTNDGTNPFNLWLKIENVVTANGVEPAAEVAEDPTHLVNDIDGVIRYDLKFGDKVIIDDGCDYTISDGTHQLNHLTTGVKDQYIFVGNFLPGESIDVTMSFTMDGATTNWAQGDTMTFDVVFYALQSEGTPPAPTPTLVVDDQTCPSGITDLCEDVVEGYCGDTQYCSALTDATCLQDEDLDCDWTLGGSCTGGAVCMGVEPDADCTDTEATPDLVCTWTPEVAGSCSGVENDDCDLETIENDCKTTLDYTAYCYDPYLPTDETCDDITEAGTCVANTNCAWMPNTYCVWTAADPGSCSGETGCSVLTEATCDDNEQTFCAWTAADACTGDVGCESFFDIISCGADEDVLCTWYPAP